MKRRSGPGVLALVLAAMAAAAAPAPGPAPTPQGQGPTARMAARLAELERTLGTADYPFANHKRALQLRENLRVAPAGARLQLQGRLVEELLNNGQPRAALEVLDQIAALPPSSRAGLPVEFEALLGDYRALAWLRIGEQDNCIAHHGSDSCIAPIRGGGVHRDKTGSGRAIAEYERLLAANPRELSWVWPLNIAYMTLGKYPEGVPANFLIPPRVFESEHDIGRFRDRASEAGVAHRSLAGGSVVEDLDGDGWLDLATSAMGLGDALHLYRNLGNGRFEERHRAAGLDGIVGGLNLVQTDYDNDGHADLFVTRGAWAARQGGFPNSLLRNRGNGQFEDVTEASGLLTFHPTQVAAWGDYDGDGWLDLFVGNESSADSAHPSELWQNDRHGRFRQRIVNLGAADKGWVKGATWIDYDNDGRQDLYVSVYMGDNLLFHNDGPLAKPGPRGEDWGFTEVGAQAGVRGPRDSFSAWAWDYDQDGWLDLAVTGYRVLPMAHVAALYLGLPNGSEVPRLYRNERNGTFRDVTREARFDRVALTMGCNFGDLDNDGWPDAYFATGSPDLRSLMPNRMLRNASGRSFQDVTTSGGFGHLQKGHGVSFADLDRDGDLDVHAVMGGAYAGDIAQTVLFENPGHGNHWISLRLEGRRSNRPALGARIRVVARSAGGKRELHAVVSTGSSFGGNPFEQHIGLGDANAVEQVEVTWPASGTRQSWTGLAIDRSWRLIEGEPKPVTLPTRAIRLGGR